MSESTASSGPAAPLIALGQSIFDPIQKFGTPVIELIMRLMMARIFFYSGLTKIESFENTVFLFQYEYNVPIIPHTFAAYSATFFELVMPVFLVLGLFTRFAALPLLGMAMVIQFHLGATNAAYFHWEHYFWMITLAYLVIRGGGALSLDNLLARRFGLR